MYNVDFLVAGFFVLLVVMLQFRVMRAGKRGAPSRVFRVMLWLCVADLLLDGFTTYLIQTAAQRSLALLYGANSAFYLAQLLIAASLFLYATTVSNNLARNSAATLAVLLAPLVAFAVLLACNVATGVLFSFDPVTHAYRYGPLRYALHALALFYTVVTVCYAAAHKKLLRRVDYLAIWQFCLIAVACVLLQAAFPDLLLTGFGIGLGAMVIFFTITNADGVFDGQSGVQDIEGFRRQADSLIRRQADAGLVFVSLEMLKTLNKLAGPGVSDALVVRLADGLCQMAGSQAVYRMKGSLFVVLCQPGSAQQQLYAKVLDWLGQEHAVQGSPMRLSCRCGGVASVLAFNSGNQIHSFIEYLLASMRKENTTSLPQGQDCLDDYLLERRIARYCSTAIENRLFSVYAQPLYGVSQDRFVGFEILSRLHHPELGFISPEMFIRLTEEEGSIGALASVQFEAACNFIAANRQRLQAAGVRDVKFNVSAVELMDPQLPCRILDRIHTMGFDPGMFCFEITETSAVRYGEISERFVKLLQEAGCKVYLDDFGSGYANLDTVMSLPFHGVKLDMQLLRNAASDEKARVLYGGLVSLLRGLGKSIVSEGVETREQFNYLMDLGVDVQQGYLFSKPLPIDEALAFVERANADRA